MVQDGFLLEAERVDVTQVPSLDAGFSQPELGLHGVGHRLEGCHVPGSQVLEHLPAELPLILQAGMRDHCQRGGRLAAKVLTEFRQQ
jgi:hypothetical protein